MAVGARHRLSAAGAAFLRARRPCDGALLLGERPRALRRAPARGGARWRSACIRCCSTGSWRTRSSSTSTRSPTARTSTSPGIMQHVEEAGVHSGDSACVLPPLSLGEEMLEEMRRQTRELALRLGVVGLLNVQFALVDNDRLHVIEANPRASRTVPFVSKAIGVPLAKVACRLILGERLAAQDLPPSAGGAPRERQGGGAPVPAAARLRRAARPGDEVHGRGDGHRRRLPDGFRQGAGGSGRRASRRGQRVHLGVRHRQAGRHAARRAHARPRIPRARHARHGAARSARWASRWSSSTRSARGLRTSVDCITRRRRRHGHQHARPAAARARTDGRSAAPRSSAASRASRR